MLADRKCWMARELGRFQERGYNLGKALKDEQDLNRQMRHESTSGQITGVLAPESILPLLSSTQTWLISHPFLISFPLKDIGGRETGSLPFCQLTDHAVMFFRQIPWPLWECQKCTFLSGEESICIHYLVLFALC